MRTKYLKKSQDFKRGYNSGITLAEHIGASIFKTVDIAIMEESKFISDHKY